ncbi:MAG: class I SAM-dependent methyltransferase [Gammaproteobacteria bacterium]|nr:class I SAM-dependent methyltransferase [Gammaproteobacteria bacterium]
MIGPDVFACLACRAPGLKASAEAWRCSGCGALYPVEDGIPLLVRDPAAHRQRLAQSQADNPEWYAVPQPPESVSPWHHHLRKRRRYVQGRIARHLRGRGQERAERLLDLGCGDGTNLAWLKDHAERLYGSDYNGLRLLRAARRATGATLFLADILDYPAAADSFDVVFFNHVIEHVPDDVGALRAVLRILTPGGLLVLGTPNEGCWWWQWAYRRAPEVLKGTDHVHFYTGLTIGSKLIKAGFRLLETHYMGWGPPDWALDGRIRQHRWVDDALEAVGRVLLPHQASSLYLLATKEAR